MSTCLRTRGKGAATVCFVKSCNSNLMEKTAAKPPWKTLCVSHFPTNTAAAGLMGKHGAGSRLRIADLSGFCIQPNQEFVSQSDADDLFGFSRGLQTLVKGREIGVITAD